MYPNVYIVDITCIVLYIYTHILSEAFLNGASFFLTSFVNKNSAVILEWSVGSKATDGRRWQVSHVYGLSTWKFCLEKMVTFLLFAFILESKVNDSYLMVRMDCEKMNIETVIKADCLQLPFVIVAFYTLPAMVMVLLFLVSRYNKICILSTHQALSTGVSLHMFGCKDSLWVLQNPKEDIKRLHYWSSAKFTFCKFIITSYHIFFKPRIYHHTVDGRNPAPAGMYNPCK